MIITLTLNPAIDKTIMIESLTTHEVNKVLNMRKDAAGKGINVARVVDSLGLKPLAVGIVAGSHGDWIKKELNQLKINHQFHEVKGETRENIKVHVKDTSDVIELNEEGPLCSSEDLDAVLKILNAVIQNGDILVLSGSAPKGLPDDVYHIIMESVRHLEPKVILDTSNELLIEGLKSKPNIIKPNRQELETYFNRSYQKTEDMIIDAQTLVENGIDEVIISLGREGSIYVSANEVYQIKGIKVNAQSAIGAGDAFVGGLAYGLHMGFDIVRRLSYAASVATASVLTEGTLPGNHTDILNFLNKIEIKKLM